ncbi:WD repeat-containing protein 13 [Heracleum sosnowskyi]|uniref:WD repeat-containing protein 13 n=1 Tax=Heracleum sosnowskyi TaxID=360622 RepID=A0AAD8LXW3_9APIA|nr:WD repeat-containing protein 13 [Heracleum sosnowskyi]
MTSPEDDRKKKDVTADPEYCSCLLQPCRTDSDPNYTGIRRLLLSRKPHPSLLRRKDWRCKGRGYVAFRNYINRPKNWENLHNAGHTGTPGQSGNWMQSLGSFGQLSLLLEGDSWSTIREVQSNSQALSQSASLSSNASESPRIKGEPAYSFVGMHCIFDQSKAMVTVLKFGHMSSDLLAYGAADGTLTICTVSETPSIIKQLTGHSKDVTDFDFSLSNQYIASSSEDKTVRVWDISKGICIRVIYGVSAQLCIRFHPVNNNFLLAGNSNREINVFNFSTGRVIHKAVFDSAVTAMDHDHTGQFIFCGDAQGSIYTVKINSHTGNLSRTHRNRSGSKQKSPVTTVQYRIFSLLSRGPVLLSFTRDGSLSYFSVSLEIQGYLTIRCSLRLGPRLHSIRASFCPLLSLEKGEYIVVGSDDANVYFYDLTRPKHPCVNKLQGHGYSVVGVAWNHGENFLASSDFGGTVIVWRRAKTK